MTTSKLTKGLLRVIEILTGILLISVILSGCSQWCADGPIFRYEYICHTDGFSYNMGGFNDADYLGTSLIAKKFHNYEFRCPDADSVSVAIKRLPSCVEGATQIAEVMDTITIVR